MPRLLGVLVIAALTAIIAIYVLLGPSVFLGGPTSADITTASRSLMLAAAPSPAEATAARDATVTPKGLCRQTGTGKFACIVEVTAPGTPTRSFLAEMRKSPAGGWLPVP